MCTVYDAHQQVRYLPPMLICGHTAAQVFDLGSIRIGRADRITLTPHHQSYTVSAPVVIVTPARWSKEDVSKA